MLEFYPNANSLPHQQGLMHQTETLLPLSHHHNNLHHHQHHHHNHHNQQPAAALQQSAVPMAPHNQQHPPPHPHHSTPEMLANPLSCSVTANGRTEVGTIKCEKNYELCEGCDQKIHDRYLMRVGDASWHEQCLSCGMCGVPLNNSCYVRNGKLYCKLDYDRLFSIKCSRCGDRVQSHDMIMRAQSFVFHLPCFMCCVCCQPLQKGEQFVLRSGQLFCRHDFEKDLYLTQQLQPHQSQHAQLPPHQQQQQSQQQQQLQHLGVTGSGDDDLILDGDTIRPRDGRRGPKRPRTILTSAQRRQFKASFELSPKPCRKVREALAKDTGLSVRVVQVWFQNQRAKMKKIQRKSKQTAGGSKADDQNEKEGGKENGGGGNGGGEKRIKQESPSSENGHYLGMDGSFGGSQPLNPNMPFSPDDYPANSNDSFCSSDISMDGSTFDQLDEATSDTLSLQNMDLHGGHHAGSHHHNSHNHNHTSSDSGIMCGSSNNNQTSGQSGNINPIDKLYLMQNSYFSAGEH